MGKRDLKRKNVKNSLEQMKKRGNVFDFENDEKRNVYPIDAFEQMELLPDMTNDYEDSSVLTYNFPPNSTYIINASKKFFIDMHLTKSVKRNDNKWTDFEPAAPDDLKNLTFYPNFVAKKFKVDFYLKDIKLETVTSFDDLSASLESYIMAHMDPSQRKMIFGGVAHDSSEFNYLYTEFYKPDHEEYLNFLSPLVGTSNNYFAFTPLLRIPWSNKLEENGFNLKNTVLPEISGGTGYSLKLRIRPGDTHCFYQNEETKDKIIYKLQIKNIKFFVQKIRYRTGYDMPISRILGSKSNNLPTWLYETFLHPVNTGDTYIQRTFSNIVTPSRILIFKVKSEFIKGIAQSVSYEDIDSWTQHQISEVSVHNNGLKIYDSDYNPVNQTTYFARYQELVKDKVNFLGYKLNETLSGEFIHSTSYKFPSVKLNFQLDSSSDLTQKTVPVLASNTKILDEKNELVIRLQFNKANVVQKGIYCFCFFYERENFQITRDGYFINPLVQRT